MTASNWVPHRIGVAADHGGYCLKEQLATLMRGAGYEVIDFGNYQLTTSDDYPDFVIPLARAVAAKQVDRGAAVCGSGVGACIVANKLRGVRACLIHETYSARQGVEDDDLNLISLGGWVVSAATVIVAACEKLANWKWERQEHERQSTAAIGNVGPIHLDRLHPSRSNFQWRASAFD